VNLNSAHAYALALGKEFEFGLFIDSPGNQSAGNHRAEAFHGEDAINGETGEAGGIACGHLGGHTHKSALQVIHSSAGKRTDWHNPGVGWVEECPAQEVFDFQADDVEGFRVDEIGLGEHGDSATHGEQAADIEMFASLRLDGFIGRDYEKNEINAADTSEHVAYETLVAGDVDEAQAQGFAAGGSQLEMCEADVDGDAAALLFFQAVGIDAGEGLDQRGFAVIDVARGADDDGFHCDWNDTRGCGFKITAATYVSCPDEHPG